MTKNWAQLPVLAFVYSVWFFYMSPGPESRYKSAYAALLILAPVVIAIKVVVDAVRAFSDPE